jgi:short-subunit dehydrogenase
MKDNLKIAIVTGASSGIGEATAKALVNAGYKVYGTARSPKTENNLSYTMLPLDINNEESIRVLVNEVIKREGKIDVLVNNAGIGLMGPIEETSMTQIRSVFETNVFGTIQMTKEVLPYMREHGGGTIVNISSVLGKIPFPGMGIYSASKHAVEAFSEALNHEVRNLNIRSILIEPGLTKTKFDNNSIYGEDENPIYDSFRAHIRTVIDIMMKTADEPETIAEIILKAISEKNPKLRYAGSSSAGKLLFLRKMVPEMAFDSTFRKQLKLK